MNAEGPGFNLTSRRRLDTAYRGVPEPADHLVLPFVGLDHISSICSKSNSGFEEVLFVAVNTRISWYLVASANSNDAFSACNIKTETDL